MDSLFPLYFEFEPNPEIIHSTHQLESFFQDPVVFCEYFQFRASSPHPTEFGLNFHKLIQDSYSSIELNQIFNSLRYDPLNFLPSLHVAVHSVLRKNLPEVLDRIRVYISKYDVVTPLSAIRSALIQRFVCITGNIVKVYCKKPFVTSMEFLCNKCKNVGRTEFPEGKFLYPKICASVDCKNMKMFTPIRESAICVDYQRIKVQENSNDEQCGVPLTIDCESRGLDISEVSVGDPVTVMGIVKAESSDLHKNKNTGLYGLYLEIISISSVKEAQSQCEEFTETEIQRFKELAKTANIFPLLVKNFCSLIYGLEKIKAGLLLALLGGSDDQGRSASHILIVGDPGLGKTQLLRTAVNLSLRGIYVSATTRAGLTVNVSRESGQCLMRAGALIMADDGLCAIDEFDKMGKDQQAMLEVMEQQTITVAKSGVFCSLKARATVIAAANSTGGHFNPAKGLADNIKINAALLSRFDLIFLLLDNHDTEVSKHVISMHGGRKRKFSEAFMPRMELLVKRSCTQSSGMTQRTSNDSPFDDESYTGFLQRVVIGNGLKIEVEEIRRYLAYARKFCKPKLTDEAIEIINQYFTIMRKETHLGSLSITTRQLESLRRLTEARAKSELRESATENDAIEIIKLYQESIYDLKPTNLPKSHQSGKSIPNLGELSVAKQQSAFIDHLHSTISAKNTDLLSFHELLEISKSLGLRVGDFNLFIEKLNMSNILLKKGPGLYKVCLGNYL